MFFSFRKSVKAGPMRLNVSKSGLGVSAGVKGARVGINSKGNVYSSVGAKGMYYRSQTSGNSQQQNMEDVDLQSTETQKPVIIGISIAITLAFLSWILGFFSPILKICGFILSGFILLVGIVIGLSKLHFSENTNSEVLEPNEYAETVKTHIIQDTQLSDEDIDALILEYCQAKCLSNSDTEQMKIALLKERTDYQGHKA